MVTLSIGGAELPADNATPAWINQQINPPRAAGVPVCVRVRIEQPSVNMILSTPTCGSGRGGWWQPNDRERRIADLWNRLGLGGTAFTGGNVIAFLQQLPALL